MHKATVEGIKTTVRYVSLAVISFVLEAVIEKLTKSTFFYKELLFMVLTYLDNYVHEKQKEYQIKRFDLPIWLKFKFPL